MFEGKLKIVFVVLIKFSPWTMAQQGPTGAQGAQTPQLADRYIPKEVEKRPWTDRTSKLEGRVPFHFMELNHRDIHVNCDGQCFYHSGTLAVNNKCRQASKNCGLIAAVSRHGHQQCGNIGTAIGFNGTVCTQDQFYTISLVRKNLFPSCTTPWDFGKKMPCIPTEFVAIAFYTGNDAALNDKDKWNVCVAGESTVTMWTNVKTQAIQIKYNLPYDLSASGIIDSQMVIDKNQNSFVCRFILSANKLNEDENADVKFPLEDDYKGDAIKVKVAQGRVLRHIVAGNEIPDSIKKQGSVFSEQISIQKDDETRAKERTYFITQQALIRPIFERKSLSTPDETETVYVNAFSGPSADTIDFLSLQITNVRLLTIPSEKDETETAKAITSQVERCDSEVRNKAGRFFRCFAPNNQRNCIYREKCPVMIIVEEAPGSSGLQKLQFRLIGFLQPHDTLKKVTRPFGWAALGFSKDSSMGNDLVVACQTTGEQQQVIVSWNIRHSNVFDININQDLIDAGATIKNLRTRKSDKFMCEWTMNTELEVDVSTYPGIKNQDSQGNNVTKVKFDLRNETYLLLASGTRIYEDLRMGYHGFRQTLREKLILQSKAPSVIVSYQLIFVSVLVSFSLRLAEYLTLLYQQPLITDVG